MPLSFQLHQYFARVFIHYINGFEIVHCAVGGCVELEISPGADDVFFLEGAIVDDGYFELSFVSGFHRFLLLSFDDTIVAQLWDNVNRFRVKILLSRHIEIWMFNIQITHPAHW